MIHLYIIDYFSLSKSNGLNTYVTQLSESLSKKGNEVKLNHIWINSLEDKDFKKKMEKGVSHFHIPRDIVTKNSSNFDAKAAEWLVAQMSGQRNIVVHFNWINHCPFVYLLKKRIPCKTILTKHCIPWRDRITDNYGVFSRLNHLFSSSGANLSVLPAELLKEQPSYRAMEHIICVTRFAAHSLQKMMQYPAEKTSVIYNGISAGEFSRKNQSKMSLRKEYGFAPNEKILLFAGAITARKGSHDLVMAFDKLQANHSDKKLRLIFAGIGDHNKLLANVKSSWAKITITGRLAKRQLYDFYVMADIGIIPSYVEQCSYTTIEMMSIGLPIIAADVDGLTEIVPDDCGLKVRLRLGNKSASLDEKDLSEKLLYFIKNKTIAEEYGARAKEYAQKQFSSERMVQKTIGVYKKMFTQNNASDNDMNLSSMEKPPLVSLVLPCYNSEIHIKECLNSILNQSWENYELIVVDDDSTDHTASIINSYDDSRVTYIKNERNRGIVYSLNRGVSLAKGKYIARIDADDWMHKDRLAKQVKYLEEHSDTALVGSWHSVVDQSGKAISLKQHFTQDEEIKLILPFKNPFSHPSVMIRSTILKATVYDNIYEHCEDYDLWTKIVSNYKVANIPEYLIYYRVHPSNNRRVYIKTQKQNALELQSTIMDEWGLNPTVEELVIHAMLSTHQAKQYFTSEERINALTRWINKVLRNRQQQYNLPESLIQKMSDYLIYDCCDISPTIKSEIPIPC